MQEFFLFVVQAVVVISIFWYIGVNFFRHSHEISEWWDRRRLKKIADEHKNKVFDIKAVYQEQFGFLETPEYVKKRMVEIQNELSDSKSGDHGVNVNALEFIFLIDELNTDVLKTEKGIYIVSRKNINDLLRQQERDTLHYAKKMREYALRFLPKEGEPIELEADQLLYWVRNGMLKRPGGGVGNRTFTLSSGLQEVCLELKEDFVEPHYLLEVVSHSDYLRIKERRVQIDKKALSESCADGMDNLVEGRLISFSDNTRRMKIGNEVIVYDHLGNTWREDLKGNRLNAKQDIRGKRNEPGLSAEDFIINESRAAISEAGDTELEARLPSLPSKKIKSMLDGDVHSDNSKSSLAGNSLKEKINKTEIKKTDFVKKTEPQRVELKKPEPKRSHAEEELENEINKEEVPVCAEGKNKHAIIDGFFEELKDDAFKYRFVQEIEKNKFPYGMIGYSGFAYVPIKTLLENTFKYLSQSGKESFISEIEGPHRKISDHRLARFYQALSDAGIILFRNTLLRHDTIMFKHDDQRYKIKAVRISPNFCKSTPPEEVELVKDPFKINKSRWLSIGFLDENREGANRQMSNTKKQPVQAELNLRKELPQKPKANTEQLKPAIKPIAELTPVHNKKESGDAKPKPVNLTKPKPGVQKEQPGTVQSFDAKQQKMRRETFVRKFCSEEQLFRDEVFEKKNKDCEQFFYTFRINPEDSNEALLFFEYEKFAELLWPFLKKEGVEYNESNKFLNAFLRDDLKGDLSTRFIYTVPDKTVFKVKLVSLRVPIEKLDGLRLDVGYRGGYRETELKKNLDNAIAINDKALAAELQGLADSIREQRVIECKEGE